MKERDERLTFCVRRLPTRRGGGREVCSLPRKFVLFGFRGREPEKFARMFRTLGGVQTVCAKKVRVRFSAPSSEHPPGLGLLSVWERMKKSDLRGLNR